jgi:predicted nucleic acid-binding protein
MARSFLDTSALVKYYHPEEGTREVTQVVQEHNARHYISRLGIVEAQHAFTIKLRTGDITETDFEGLRQRLLRDIGQGQFQHVRVTEPHYREAERLMIAYRRRRFRTLDALQLAVALDLRRRDMIEYFVCADTRLCETAQEEGLLILNPVQP